MRPGFTEPPRELCACQTWECANRSPPSPRGAGRSKNKRRHRQREKLCARTGELEAVVERLRARKRFYKQLGEEHAAGFAEP